MIWHVRKVVFFGVRLELYSSRGKWGHKTIKGLLALLAKSLSSSVCVSEGSFPYYEYNAIAVFSVVSLPMRKLAKKPCDCRASHINS